MSDLRERLIELERGLRAAWRDRPANEVCAAIDLLDEARDCLSLVCRHGANWVARETVLKAWLDKWPEKEKP